jgi:ABC-2 type transport system ATP-binding protein
VVAELKEQGVTIILTTHYIEEAEAIADRVGVINGGELLLVEEKAALMQRLGQKTLQVDLQTPVETVPENLTSYDLEVAEDGHALRYHYDTSGESTGITRLLGDISAAGLQLKDLQTDQSSLEDIFVGLVKEGAA